MTRRTWAGFEPALERTRLPRLILLSGILALLLFAFATTKAHAQYVSDPARDAAPAGTSTSTVATPTAVRAEELLFQGALLLDYLQSMDLHRTQWVETNGILGQHPNEAHISAYFVGVGVIHYLVTRELVREHVPTSIIHGWETGTIGLEMAYVKHNASLGIHLYFP